MKAPKLLETAFASVSFVPRPVVMEFIPTDVITLIFAQLDVASLTFCLAVSRRFRTSAFNAMKTIPTGRLFRLKTLCCVCESGSPAQLAWLIENLNYQAFNEEYGTFYHDNCLRAALRGMHPLANGSSEI